MTEPRFIQIHWLASYPGTLLNRDDAGLAKRLPFGGTTRTRISSQCLKRHWRMVEDANSLREIEGLETAIRSKEIIERRVINGLEESTGRDAAIVKAVGEVLMVQLYGKKGEDRKSRQALLLGLPEVAYLRRIAEEIIQAAVDPKDAKARAETFFKNNDVKNNIRALIETAKAPAGVESALFGRMVTSDLVANMDAAIHVAHAFTVHALETELDYFTVVDDLRGREQGDDAGAAGVFETELTSGLYYGYAVVDTPLLVSNIEGVRRTEWKNVDRALAGEVVRRLVHLIATVTPGAKKGSTAPYSWAEAVLVEMGARQPRTLANAFRTAVPLRGDVKAAALDRMARYVGTLDTNYGSHEDRYVMLGDADPNLLEGAGAQRASIAGIADRLKSAIVAGTV